MHDAISAPAGTAREHPRNRLSSRCALPRSHRSRLGVQRVTDRAGGGSLGIVTLRGTDVTTTGLGFGCAGLFREPGRQSRLRILAEAHDLGITHFDVAPMYGLGLGERELGHFVAGRREGFTITSKFGIAMTPLGRTAGQVQGPLRRLLQRRPDLRAQAQNVAGTPSSGWAGRILYRRPAAEPSRLRASLERTLRALSTDYLDVLLLHDPRPSETASGELYAALEEIQKAGIIRSWGITGEPDEALSVLDVATHPIPVVQYHHDIFTAEFADARLRHAPARISFGVLSRAVGRIAQHLAADGERRERWSSELELDCASMSVIAELLMCQARRDNPEGIVLFSSTNSAHLRAAAEGFTRTGSDLDVQLDMFVRLVRSELPQHSGQRL